MRVVSSCLRGAGQPVDLTWIGAGVCNVSGIVSKTYDDNGTRKVDAYFTAIGRDQLLGIATSAASLTCYAAIGGSTRYVNAVVSDTETVNPKADTLDITVTLTLGGSVAFMEFVQPTPPAPTGDIAVLRYIRDHNPSSGLPTAWSEAINPSTWEGVIWDGDPLAGGRVLSLSLFGKEITSLARIGEFSAMQQLSLGSQDATIAGIDLNGTIALFECNITGVPIGDFNTEGSSEYLAVSIYDSTVSGLANISGPISVTIARSTLDIATLSLTGSGYLMLDTMQGSLPASYDGVKALTVIGGAVSGLDMQKAPLLESLNLQDVSAGYLSSLDVSNLAYLTSVSASGCGFTTFDASGCAVLTSLSLVNSLVSGTVDISGSPIIETVDIHESANVDTIVWPSAGGSYRRYIDISFTGVMVLYASTYTSITAIVANNAALTIAQIPDTNTIATLMLNSNLLANLGSITRKIGTAGMVYDFRFNNLDSAETSRLIALGYDSSKVLPQ